MKMKFNVVAAAAVLALGITTPELAQADHYRHYHGHTYYRHRCGGGNGAVGTVAGGVGGAVIGNAIGGGVLGTVAGGVGGALLGRHLDKAHSRHRNGC